MQFRVGHHEIQEYQGVRGDDVLLQSSRELARRLVAGDRWDLIFNLAEGVWGRSREAQVPAVCELFNQPYTFSDPLTCALALDKALAKRVVRDRGLPTPEFEIVNTPEEASTLSLPLPLFLKPLAEGSSKGVTSHSFINDQEALVPACEELLAQFHQPVLVETFLPGREVTVGIVGNGSTAGVLAVMEVIFTDKADAVGYTALNKGEYLERVSYRLVTDEEPVAAQANQLALNVYHALGCRDTARVDLRCDARGVWHFLEVNPLPGLNHIRSDLPIMADLAGLSYPQLIGKIVDSAWQRWQEH